MSKPWERIDGETSKAFGAFCIYLKLAPEERSVVAAYRVYNGLEKGDKKVSKYPNFFNRWSRDNKWKERAKAYDNESLSEALADLAEKKKKLHVTIWEAMTDVVKAQARDMESMEPKDRTSFLNSLAMIAKLYGPPKETPQAIKIEFVNMPARPKPEVSPANEDKEARRLALEELHA